MNPESLPSVTGSIVGRLGHRKGLRSKLKRLPYDHDEDLLALLMDPEPISGLTPDITADQARRRWNTACIVLANAGRYKPTQWFGTALHAAGYNTRRLANLLRARKKDLHDLLRPCVRFLRSRGESSNLTDAVRLVLFQEGEACADVRDRINNAYFEGESR